MKAKCRVESNRVFSTAVRNVATEDAMRKTTEGSIRQLSDNASILRGAIADTTKHQWIFEGDLNTDYVKRHLPKVLYSFIRWLLERLATSITAKMVRFATVHHHVLATSQNIMLSI